MTTDHKADAAALLAQCGALSDAARATFDADDVTVYRAHAWQVDGMAGGIVVCGTVRGVRHCVRLRRTNFGLYQQEN